jgi:hypothetical protein
MLDTKHLLIGAGALGTVLLVGQSSFTSRVREQQKEHIERYHLCISS